MAWFTKNGAEAQTPGPLEDIWHVCPKCQSHIFKDEWVRNLMVCPKCGHHDRLSCRDRIALLTDAGSFAEFASEVVPRDHLGFSDAKGPYAEKAAATVKKLGQGESVVTGDCTIDGHAAVLAVMDFRFFGGSLSSGAGEKIVRAVERSIERKVPFVMVSASGGARMHEGILSLMQMARTCAALQKLREAGLPYISLLTDPTTGGVSASYALIGDVNISEPGALIGFAGRRVIEATIKQKLPDDFQTAEYLRDHGFVDVIVPRSELKKRIASFMEYAAGNAAAAPAKKSGAAKAKKKPASKAGKNASSAWDVVRLARDPGRPTCRDYAEKACDEFIELRGDRVFGDDPAILGGLARIGDRRFVLIGHQKGSTTEERIACRFGMADPEGYRKALRLMRLAEKWRLPVVTLVDTAGAYPGLDAEARGQAEAIGRNLLEMAGLKTPILSIVTGEGGSGGAIGIAVADRVLMMQNAIYSVISPEGCAGILWRDGSKAPEAAAALKLTAPDLVKLGVVDGVIAEPAAGAGSDPGAAIATVRETVKETLDEFAALPSGEALVESRYRKFGAMGAFTK